MDDLDSELLAFEAEIESLETGTAEEQDAGRSPASPGGPHFDAYDPHAYADDDNDPPAPTEKRKVQVVYGAAAKIDKPAEPPAKKKALPPGFDKKKKKKAKVAGAATVELPAHLAEARKAPETAVPTPAVPAVVAKPPAPAEPIVTSVDIVPDDSPDAIPATSAVGKKALEANEKRIYLRKAAGKIWNDMSLSEWPDNDYRIFCGDLGNEVNDSTLAKVFVKYASFAKAKVIRNKRTQKTKGYGFVSFLDPFDATTALREMQGCYVGNRPIKLRKSKWSTRSYTAKGKRIVEEAEAPEETAEA